MAEPPILYTRVGHAEWGDNRAFGYSVASDLAGRESFVGLLLLSIAGRRPTEPERGLLDDIAIGMTVAEPRVWPLKLVRVVSSYANDLTAFAAGQLCQSAAPIGLHSIGRAAEFLESVLSELGEAADDSTLLAEHLRARLAEGRRLPGLGIPFRPVDERVTLLCASARARGRAELPYFRLILRLQSVLESLDAPLPNGSLATAALLLDLALTPRQCGMLAAMLCSADFVGNAVEGAEQAAPALRELPAGFVVYNGREPRATPRALAKNSR